MCRLPSLSASWPRCCDGCRTDQDLPASTLYSDTRMIARLSEGGGSAVEWLVLVTVGIVVWMLMRHRHRRFNARTRLTFEEPRLPPRGRPPRKRGLSPEEVAAEQWRFIHELREGGQASFRHTAWQAAKIRSRHYVWRSARDSDVCPVCAAKNGKRFAWNARVKGGHPGDGSLCTQGYCCCYAEPIVPKL